MQERLQGPTITEVLDGPSRTFGYMRAMPEIIILFSKSPTVPNDIKKASIGTVLQRKAGSVQAMRSSYVLARTIQIPGKVVLRGCRIGVRCSAPRERLIRWRTRVVFSLSTALRGVPRRIVYAGMAHAAARSRAHSGLCQRITVDL